MSTMNQTFQISIYMYIYNIYTYILTAPFIIYSKLQVHTTGMDIQQPLSAEAALTLGKDMNFRDYAQACIYIDEIYRYIYVYIDKIYRSRQGYELPRLRTHRHVYVYTCTQCIQRDIHTHLSGRLMRRNGLLE